MTDVLGENAGGLLDRSSFVKQPVVWIRKIDRDGNLGKIFPALERAKGVQQSEIKHAEGDVFTHTKCTLAKIRVPTPSDEAFGEVKDETDQLLIGLALLYHDTGKKERNEGPKEPKIDHVKWSMQHAQKDLAGFLSSEELADVVEMISKHEQLLEAEHITKKPNKLAALFSLGNNLRRGRLLLKFTECDCLGRRIAGGHEELAKSNESLLYRNIGLYKVLLARLELGDVFPMQRIPTDFRSEIERIMRTPGCAL